MADEVVFGALIECEFSGGVQTHLLTTIDKLDMSMGTLPIIGAHDCKVNENVFPFAECENLDSNDKIVLEASGYSLCDGCKVFMDLEDAWDPASSRSITGKSRIAMTSSKVFCKGKNGIISIVSNGQDSMMWEEILTKDPKDLTSNEFDYLALLFSYCLDEEEMSRFLSMCFVPAENPNPDTMFTYTEWSPNVELLKGMIDALSEKVLLIEYDTDKNKQDLNHLCQTLGLLEAVQSIDRAAGKGWDSTGPTINFSIVLEDDPEDIDMDGKAETYKRVVYHLNFLTLELRFKSLMDIKAYARDQETEQTLRILTEVGSTSGTLRDSVSNELKSLTNSSVLVDILTEGRDGMLDIGIDEMLSLLDTMRDNVGKGFSYGFKIVESIEYIAKAEELKKGGENVINVYDILLDAVSYDCGVNIIESTVEPNLSAYLWPTGSTKERVEETKEVLKKRGK